MMKGTFPQPNNAQVVYLCEIQYIMMFYLLLWRKKSICPDFPSLYQGRGP